MVMIDHFKEVDGSLVFYLCSFAKTDDHGEGDNTEFLPIWLTDNYAMANNILRNPAKDGDFTYHHNPCHCLKPDDFDIVEVKLSIGEP